MFAGVVSRLRAGTTLVLCATLFVSSCNVNNALSPTVTEASTSPLIGKTADGLVVVAALGPPPYVSDGSSQQIFANDLLKVDFYDVDQLDRTVRVSPDGIINMPFIGQVRAADRTISQLESTLRAEYGRDLLQNPEISVFVRHSSAQHAAMDGEFRRPGVFPVVGKTNLLELVAKAGGLTEVADDRKVFIYREFGDVRHVAQYSIADIRQGRQRNPDMYPRDVVVAFASGSKIALQSLRTALGIATSAARVAAPL